MYASISFKLIFKLSFYQLLKVPIILSLSLPSLGKGHEAGHSQLPSASA